MCIQQIHTCIYIYMGVCVCMDTVQWSFLFFVSFFFYLYQSINRLFGYKRHFFDKTNTQQRKTSSSPDIHLLLSIRFYQFSWVNTLTGFTVIALPVKRSVGKKEACDRFVDAAASLPLRTSSLFIHLQINEGTLLSVNDFRPILLKLDARYKRALHAPQMSHCHT